jgi:hypothetical protein
VATQAEHTARNILQIIVAAKHHLEDAIRTGQLDLPTYAEVLVDLNTACERIVAELQRLTQRP